MRPDPRTFADLATVFRAILPRSATSHDAMAPEALVSEYMNPDFTGLKLDATKIVARGLEDKQLEICEGAIVHVGGGGIVVQCQHQHIPGVKYALKILRPSLFRNDTDLLETEAQKIEKEFEKQTRCSHVNIARGIWATRIHQGNVLLPAILMEWVDGAKKLNKYLLSLGTDGSAISCDAQHVIQILAQCFDGMAELHSRNLIHWDIKTDNILIGKNRIPKITDLGNSRYQDSTGTKAYEVETSLWNAPPTLFSFRKNKKGAKRAHSSQTIADSRRVPLWVPDESWTSPWLDMYMFARELLRLFRDANDNGISKTLLKADELYQSQRGLGTSLYDPEEANRFLSQVFPSTDVESGFALKGIRLILSRLLAPTSPDSPAFYLHASEVASDFRKIQPEYGACQDVVELRSYPRNVARLPGWGNVPFSSRLNSVFNCPLLQRQTRHHQLGTVAHVFPGASHRRSEHSLGVAATTIQFVRALYSDRTDPFWRLTIVPEDIYALLLAAILHDSGHIAFGHFLEDITRLFDGRSHLSYILAVLDETRDPIGSPNLLASIRNDRILLDKALLGAWCPDDVSCIALRHRAARILETSQDDSRSNKSARKTRIPATLHREPAVLIRTDSDILKRDILHSILDSAIDADKLDYLMRDAHHCGVDYAKSIDVGRFFQSLTAIPYVQRDSSQDSSRGDRLKACVGVTEKGVLPVESLLIARYQMYLSVYWQHTTRAETAMLQHVVHEFLAEKKLRIENEEIPSPEGRLDALIVRFRDFEDRQALEWLKTQFRNNACNTSNEKVSVCVEILEGLLGDRTKIFWEAYVLRFDGTPSAEKIFLGLEKMHRTLAMTKTFHQYFSKWKQYRQLPMKLLKHLLSKEVVLRDGDLLIDIPPSGKDQIENIFVRQEPDGIAVPIEKVSAFAAAVRDTFRYWARRPRVFLSPEAWRRLRYVGVSERDVRSTLEKAFAEWAKDPLPLFENLMS